MKKLGWLLSCLFVVSLGTSSAYALTKCTFNPASGTCGTSSAAVMLKNTNNLEYWKNPKCLDLIIKYVEAKETQTSEDDKKSIGKGFNTADTYWHKNAKKPEFWQYADRKNYINYKIGTIHAGCSASLTRGNVCVDAPGCSFTINGKEYPLSTGEEIVNFIATNFPPSDPSRQQLLEILAGEKICLMKLNDLRTAEWANSTDYVTLLRNVTDPTVTSVADAYLDADKRHYDKCVMQGERKKMESFLKGNIPSRQGGGQGGGGGNGQGGGGNGNGNGSGSGNGGGDRGHRISNFKISR